MSGGFPQGIERKNFQYGGASTGSTGNSLTSGATIGAIGAYTTIVASTAYDAAWLDLMMNSYSAGAHSATCTYSVTLAVGSVGNEVPFASDIVYDCPTSSGHAQHFEFPVNIPAGSRISAALRSFASATTDFLNVAVELSDSPLSGIQGFSGHLDTYGFNTTTMIGAAVDPGGTINTPGAYTQITASLTNDIAGFLIGIDNQGNLGAGFNGMYLVDIATGAAASEVIFLPKLQLSRSNFGPPIIESPPYFGPIFRSIPAGTRVAIRAQSSMNTATYRVFGATLYGIRA